MCIRGLTQPSSRTPEQTSDPPGAIVAVSGVIEGERRTIFAILANGFDADSHLATADLARGPQLEE